MKGECCSFFSYGMQHHIHFEWKRFTYLQVLKVQVSLVLVGGLVAAMTVGNDGVKQILEDFVGLLITSHAAHGHDEGVACVGHGRKIQRF